MGSDTEKSDWEIESNHGGGDDDNDEEFAASGWSADHILVFLDCGIPMWKGVFTDPEFDDDDLLAPVDVVLKKLAAFLQHEIRQRATWKTGRRNGFGLYLFNTRQREHVEWESSPLKHRANGAPVDTATTEAEGKAEGGSQKKIKANEDDEDDEDDEEDEEDFNTVSRTSSVHELIPLEPPGIATIKTLKAVQDDPFVGRSFDIEDAYAPTSENHDPEQIALQTAFMMAGQILQDAKCVHTTPKDDRLPDRVRIWIITNEDNVGEFAKAAAQDLVDRKYEIYLWPLPRPDKDEFDYTVRFESMPFIQNQAEGLTKKELLAWWESSALEEELDIWKTVRPIHRLPMLWPGEQETSEETPYLQLHWFRLVQTARRPGKIVVHQETGVQLTSLTQIIEKDSISQDILYEKVTGDKDTPPKISPRLCSYVEIQGTRVPISEEEKIQLKAMSHPHKYASLRVIGFRPANSIDRTTASIEQAYFCIPPDDNETRVRGSRPAFSAIHEAMMTKNALMIGEVLTRKSATTRIVVAWALPEKLEKDEDGEEDYLVRPPGLLVIVLPFHNEIKRPFVDEATKSTDPLASDALVEEAKAFIEGLTIEPEFGVDFPSHSLELFWDKLEELALNERKTRNYGETIMSHDDVVTRVGKHLDQFINFLPDDPVPVKKKRERERVPDESGVDWLEAYAEGELDAYKVNELKMFLRSVGEKVSGNKSELIERMKPHLEQLRKDGGSKS